LEIVTTASGVVYPREGDILYMRLFESGRFQYDSYPEQHPPDAVMGKVPITTKESAIDPAAVQEIIALAEQPDFQSAKSNYPGFQPHVDDRWVETIRYTYRGHAKSIAAVNFWDMKYHPEERAEYPPSLVRLMERLSELRTAAINDR
jgi:hypothetical protein